MATPATARAAPPLLYSHPAAQIAVASAGLVALAAAFHYVYRLGDLKLYVVETIGAGLAAGIAWLVILFLLEKTSDCPVVFWIVLVGALVFRAQLFPLPQSLSDDVHRYRWDARVQAAGFNPYTIRPDDPRAEHLRDAYWAKTPGLDIPTIYPPLAELIHLWTYRAIAHRPPAEQLLLFKLPGLGADLLVLGLLAIWVRATHARNYQLAIYAWNPLVVVEFAASGHNDALAMAGVVAASLVIIRGRRGLSTLLLAAAALAKLFPVVLIPAALGRAGWPRKWQGWAAALAVAALFIACAWPYHAALGELRAILVSYEGRWMANNAGLWSFLRWFSGSRELATGIGVGCVAGLMVWLAASPKLRTPDAGSGIQAAQDSARAAFLLTAAIFLFSPNAFPWYFLWSMPLLAMRPCDGASGMFRTPWLLLSVTQFLSYHVLIDFAASGKWYFQPEYLWLTYGPFFALAGWMLLRKQEACAE